MTAKQIVTMLAEEMESYHLAEARYRARASQAARGNRELLRVHCVRQAEICEAHNAVIGQLIKRATAPTKESAHV